MTATATPAALNNATLQALVDACAKRGGGTVEVPPGTYMMRDALHLRDNVHITGPASGARAILKKVPSFASKIPDYLGYGHYEFTVEHPEKFDVGMGVHLFDKNAHGFYTTVATIVGKQGRCLLINRPMSHDYSAGSDAQAVTLHSLIEGEGANNASVENIVIDGNLAEETRELNGCRGAGVFLIMCNRITLRGLEIKNFRGDAISFQQCTDIRVENNDIHDNTGGGMHPGSGSVRYTMINNKSHHNGRFGLFYCLRTSHSICRGNEFHHNGEAGISIGERDTDHLIEGNSIHDNNGAGVEWRPALHEGGDRVRIVGNTIGGNCVKRSAAEIIVAQGIRDVAIESNTIRTSPGKTWAVAVKEKCAGVSAWGNTIDGRAQTPADVVDFPKTEQDAQDNWDSPRPGPARKPIAPSSPVSFTKPAKFPEVGPAALPLEGARHLHIDRLPAWS